MKTYSTIIAGSRTVESIALVEQAIAASGFRITEVVSGCAPGADLFGEQWAKRKMIPIRRFPVDWRDLSHPQALIKANAAGRKYDARAGLRRNDVMARYADQLIAVWDGVSHGTADMIDRATRYGLLVYVYNYGKILI
jgi:hypothetical protein